MQSRQQTKTVFKNPPQNFRGLWDKTKRSNICVNRVPEGEEKKYDLEKSSEEIMVKIFGPKCGRNTQIQEAW